MDEGRLAIVGGTDTMLDVNMPGGESFVRQVLYGKGYFREALGVDVTVGWQLDTFGHHAQMPQLLKLAGLRSFWFFRGVPELGDPAEFLWEGLDGTRIPAFWLPLGYAISYGSPPTLPEFSRVHGAPVRRAGALPHRPATARARAAPTSARPRSISRRWSPSTTARQTRPLRLCLATPAEYEAAVGLGDGVAGVGGRAQPDLPGHLQQPHRAQAADPPAWRAC